MFAKMRTSKGTLMLSIKSTDSFSRVMGTKASTVPSAKVESIMYPLVAMDIEDITTGQLRKKRKSRIAMPANEFLPARNFNYGNWRQTDSRGLIRGVGCKEKGHTTGTVREKSVTSSIGYNNWQLTDSFGLAKSALAALRDVAADKIVEQGDAGGCDGTKHYGTEETAEEKGGYDGLRGSKAADGDRKGGCCGCGGCDKNERKEQNEADMSDSLNCKAHKHNETMDQLKKTSEDPVVSKEGNSKGEEEDAVWGHCSYPYTRLF